MAHSVSLKCPNITRQGHHLKTWKKNSPYCKGAGLVSHWYCYIEWNKICWWGYAEGSWSWLQLLLVKQTCRRGQTTWSGRNANITIGLMRMKNQAYVKWQNDPSSKSKAVQDEGPLVGQKGRWGANVCRLKQLQTPSWSGPTPYYQLMDQHWSGTRRLWENNGQNI